MKSFIPLAALLLTVAPCASSHQTTEELRPAMRFAFNVTALEAATVQPIVAVTACEKFGAPLPEDVAQRFKTWRSVNADLLDNMPKWRQRSRELIAASTGMTPASVGAPIDQDRASRTQAMEQSLSSISAARVGKFCRQASEIVSAATIYEDPEIREHYEEVRRLEKAAFEGTP